MSRRWIAAAAALACSLVASGEEAPPAPEPAPAAPASAPAAAPSAPRPPLRAPDYDWLTAATIPPPNTLAAAAMEDLPRTVTEQQNWLKRMRRAAWMPSFELRYVLGEAVSRPYTVVERSTVVSGTERSSERSRETGAGEIVGGSRSSVTRFDSTEMAGLDSYARSEELEWVNEYGVFLTWDLSRFVFNRDEIAAVTADMDLAAFRRAVRDQIIQVYYDLKECLLMLDTEALRESVPTRARKERLAYQLDMLSSGEFSRAAGHEPPP